jgi:hypothetical protein
MIEALWKEFVLMVLVIRIQMALMLTPYTLVTDAARMRHLNAELD